MDKKELKKATREVYEAYGFVKKDKCFYLDLEDVLICSGFDHLYGYIYLAYNFSIKGIHSENEYMKNDMFTGFDAFQQNIYFNEDHEVPNRKRAIFYEEYSVDDYSKKLARLLKRYFDPFKENALKHIVDSYLDAVKYFNKVRTSIDNKFDDPFSVEALAISAKKQLEYEVKKNQIFHLTYKAREYLGLPEI